MYWYTPAHVIIVDFEKMRFTGTYRIKTPIVFFSERYLICKMSYFEIETIIKDSVTILWKTKEFVNNSLQEVFNLPDFTWFRIRSTLNRFWVNCYKVNSDLTAGIPNITPHFDDTSNSNYCSKYVWWLYSPYY